MDETVPDIFFDAKGKCNYCKFHNKLAQAYPRGQKGKKKFDKLIKKMKKDGKNKKYDCIIGISGGTDSTYLLYLVKKLGLRPLAVNIDNGWHAEIAINNTKKAVSKLGVDLKTYVIDWEEMKDIHVSLMKAALPWPDGASDIAITSGLYRVADQEDIKYILIGHDFRTEGKQPDEWTHVDGRMIKAILKKIGKVKIKSYPNLTIFKLLYYGIFKGIKNVRPYWYLEYNKSAAKKIIEKELDWQYYGEHHHESIYTRFMLGYWLIKKFNIDKRKVTYSALIRSGEMTREKALNRLKQPPYNPQKIENDKNYVLKKLNITEKEFEKIWNNPNKSFNDYPSYYPLFKKYKRLTKFGLSLVMPIKPMMSFELEKGK